ncbi:MAG: hypothetical protein QM760_21090 [Nibricoccus sp.]
MSGAAKLIVEMTPTSVAILQTILATDSSLTPNERGGLERLFRGEPLGSASSTVDDHLLIAQKKAAALLDVSRATIWRMTKDQVLQPVEIFPGTWRYRYRDVVALSEANGASVVAAGRSDRLAV